MREVSNNYSLLNVKKIPIQELKDIVDDSIEKGATHCEIEVTIQPYGTVNERLLFLRELTPKEIKENKRKDLQRQLDELG